MTLPPLHHLVHLLCRSMLTDYLPTIFEALLEQLFPSQGLVLLDAHGHLLQSNTKARKVCNSLNGGNLNTQHGCVYEAMNLPSEIQSLYKEILNSKSVLSDQRVKLHEDIILEDSTRIRLNAEWVQIGIKGSHYVLITIEDLTELSHQQALFDAYRYNLTSRELEVWKLYLQGLSYRQISEKLFISINTVKRHMKNIHSKRHFGKFQSAVS